ncbi:homoserine O- acetyltransferase [Entomortierella lignicola]|nr:homoserine O- acetyltransferase [Entomortierella lignicola]
MDFEDWCSDLMGACSLEGKGKVIDGSKFYIVCLNVMRSPYGSASSLTTNPDTDSRYGPEIPQATIRDDCRLHKIVLDDLGINSVAIRIGGSMAGMHVFEWKRLYQVACSCLCPCQKLCLEHELGRVSKTIDLCRSNVS